MKSQMEINKLIGLKLAQTRECLGMTLEEVARYLEYPNYQTVRSLEKGTRKIQAYELSLLSKLYKRSINYFLDSEKKVESNPIIVWRKKPEESKARLVENDFLSICENYRLLENINKVDRPKFKPKDIDRESFEKSPFQNAEYLATELIRVLAIGPKPALLMSNYLPKYLGINIISLNLGPGGSAASLYNQEDAEAAILVNSYEYEGRRNYSIAHELFHLITWYIFDAKEIYDDERGKSKVEQYADVFARVFLMPAESIQADFKKYLTNNKISIVDCIHIAKEYRVSLEALLWRLVSLRCIDKKQVQELKHIGEIATYSKALKEEKKEIFSDDYINLAIKALKRGNISKGKFADMLRISIAEVKSFLIERGYDENEDYTREFAAA